MCATCGCGAQEVQVSLLADGHLDDQEHRPDHGHPGHHGQPDHDGSLEHDHHHAGLGLQLVEGASDHGGIEVAAGPGVDLDAARTGGTDPFSVDRRLLIALDDAQGEAGVDDRTFQ